ncbi:HEAT repeat domain-containing protein [Streptomyces sp. NPDC058357]|uniref:HEAT repeat domain-containing protein n=1 Tax=unclassified Streptomyces TaxID=2593676 RepID=UPI00365F6253
MGEDARHRHQSNHAEATQSPEARGLGSAVRAGDTRAVRAPLESGADPGAVDATGLPVLCAAVAAYDERVAAASVEDGADPDRLLPDGTTPLWRAVDGGSPAIVSAVPGDEPRPRLAEASRLPAARPGAEPVKEEAELLAAWAAEETESEVLAQVLAALSEHRHPGQEAIALRYADHPDPRVRRRVPETLHGKDAARTAAATSALLALARDPDADVRGSACTVPGVWDGLAPETVPALLRLARDPDARVRAAAAVAVAVASRDRSPAVADALMTLLDEDDQLVRLEAAHGPAQRDDPRDRRGGTARSPSSTTTGSVGSGGGHGGRRTRRPSLIGPWGPAPPRATSDSRQRRDGPARRLEP